MTKVKGWILTYTLTLTTIATLIMYTMLALFDLQRRTVSTIWVTNKTKLDQRSGVNMYLSNSKKTFVEKGYKNIKLKEIELATMHLLKIQSFYGIDTAIVLAQMGSILAKDSPIIILPKSIYPLKISGTCALIGSLQIPFGRLEKYTGLHSKNHFELQLVNPNSSKTNDLPPPIYDEDRNQNKKYVNKLSDLPLFNSFANPTQIFFSSNPIHIKKSYSGNIIIVSTKSITLNSISSIDMVILKAPKIFIQKNWSGRGTFIAASSMNIDNNATFKYPSSILLTNKDPSLIKFSFPNGSKLHGSLHINGNSNTPIPEIQGTINGSIYSSIPISFSGKVSGQLWVPKFSFITASSSYTNLISNVTIDHYYQQKQIPLPHQYSMNKKAFIQWLE